MGVGVDILVYYRDIVCPVSVYDWNLSPSVKLASLTVETDRIQIQKEKVWQPLILRSYFLCVCVFFFLCISAWLI